MFVMGTSDESESGATALDLVAATDGEVAAVRGGGAARDDATGTRGSAFTARAVAATSPPLALRDPESLGLAEPRVMDARVLVAADVDRSSDDVRTQPSRVTEAQPVGAGPDPTTTLVPASSEATLRADVPPRARTMAARLPTRGDAAPRCDDSLARSTNPSIDTFV